MLDISCGSSAEQTIHMKCQDFLSLKKKECRLLQILLGALRVKNEPRHSVSYKIVCAPSEHSDQSVHRTG